MSLGFSDFFPLFCCFGNISSLILLYVKVTITTGAEEVVGESKECFPFIFCLKEKRIKGGGKTVKYLVLTLIEIRGKLRITFWGHLLTYVLCGVCCFYT